VADAEASAAAAEALTEVTVVEVGDWSGAALADADSVPVAEAEAVDATEEAAGEPVLVDVPISFAGPPS